MMMMMMSSWGMQCQVGSALASCFTLSTLIADLNLGSGPCVQFLSRGG